MKPRRNLFLGSFLVAFSMAQTAQAASLEWKGSTSGLTGGTSDTWDTNTTANWWDGSTLVNWPALGGLDDDAIFGGTAGTVTITTATANDITFNTTGYTLSGGTLTLNGTTPTITNGTGIDATISSKISGTAGLTKAGTGILTLSGANDYTGTTTISAGILKAGNAAALGSNLQGTTVSSGATLDIGGFGLGTEVVTISGTGVGDNGAIINSGGQQINALGRLVLGADATIGGDIRWDLRNSTPTLNLAGYTLTKTGANYIGLIGVGVTADDGANTGDIIINEGELNISTGTNLGGDADNTVTINNGGTLGFYQSSSAHAWTLNLNTGSTLRGENGTSSQNIWAGAVNANGNFTLLAESGHNLTIQGNISGTGGLTKTGTGTAFLTGNNSSWSGGLTISAGSLQVNSANSLGTNTTITTSGVNNAALVLGDGITAGSGKTITIAGGGASQYFGALSTAGSSTWEGNVVIGAATGTRIGTLGSGTLTVDGIISETAASELIVRPNTSGTVVFSNSNTFTGNVSVVAGTLRVTNSQALGLGTKNFNLQGGDRRLELTNNITLGSNITLNLQTNTNNGVFSSGGTNAIQGAINLTSGGASVGSNDSSTLTLSGNVIGAGGTALNLYGTSTNANTLSGNISDGTSASVALNKEQAGTWWLTGSASTFTGAVSINAGKLVVGNTGALGATSKTINVNAGGTLELATDSVIPTYSFNTSSGGTGTIILNRATAGAALSQDVTTYALGNSIITFEAGANVTSGTPTVNIPTAVYTAGVTGLGYAKLNPNGVNLNIGTLSKTGNQSAIRLGGTSTGNIITGVVSGSYSLTKEDAGTWELAGANTYAGATTVSNGKLIFSGDRTTVMGGALTVGNVAGQTGILDIKGDLAMGGNGISVGYTAAGAVGIINHSDGDVTLTGSSNALLIGGTTGGVSGTYNLSGGKLTPYSATADRGVMIGVNAGSAGNLINATFNLSGTGVLDNSTGSGVLQVVRGDAASSYQNSTYNQTGGTSTNKVLLIGGNGANGANSTATFSVTGGTFSATTFSNLSRGNSVISTMTIGGTADVTLPAFPTTRGTSSTATLTFDGGVLRPTASSTTYLGGLTNAYINGGGAKFNTGAFDITVSQNLLAGTGSGGFTKEGAGILTLSGANTYTGSTTISAGTLSAGNIVVASGNSGLGNASSNVVLGSAGAQGKLSYTGNSATYVRGFTVGGAGGGALDVTTSGQTLTVDTVGVDGTGDFTVGGAGSTTIKGIVSHTGSIIKTGAGTLQLNLSSSVAPLANTFTGGASILAGTLNLANALGSGGQLTTPGGDVAGVYYLGDTSGSTGATLSIANNNITFNNPINVRNGSSGTKTLSISGSSVNASHGGTITLNDNLTVSTAATSSTLNLNGVIEDGVSGSKGITVSGGVVVVSNTNTYTGTTSVTGGTLTATKASALPGYNSTGQVVVNGGTLAVRIGGSGWTEVELNSLISNATKTSGNLGIDTTNGNFTPTSALNIGALGLAKNGSNMLVLDQANSFTGNVTVNAGTLRIAHNDALGTTAKTVDSRGGSRIVELSGGITLGSHISFLMSSNSGDGSGLSSVSGNNVIDGKIDYSFGLGALNISSSAGSTLTINGNVQLVEATRGITFGGASTNDNTVNGDISSNSVAKVLSVTKQGAGKWIFEGTNTYSGTTSVNGGTLVINGDNSGATGAVTVSNADSRLAGSGTIGGNTTINATAIHSPGNSPGVQAFTGNMTYADGSIFEWDIDRTQTQTRGTGYDGVNVTGTLTGLDGTDDGTDYDAKFRIVITDADFSNTFWDANKTWSDIFTAADGTTAKSNWADIFGGGFQYYYNNGSTLTSIDAPDSGTVGYFTLSGSALSWTAVPEPTSALVGLLIGAGLLRRRRVA